MKLLIVPGRAAHRQTLPLEAGSREGCALQISAHPWKAALSIRLFVSHSLAHFVSHSLAHFPPRPRKPIPEQVKPFEGLRPLKPRNPSAGVF